jgi:hypothetical protein
MRRVAIMAATLVPLTLAACGGGGPDRRERVEDYMRSANGIQAHWKGSFERANEAYQAFARSELKDDEAVAALQRAERGIRTARDELAGLRPPADARRLHDKLVALFDMNLGFADQTTRLAAYVPAATRTLAPLDRANRRLQRELRDAKTPGGQARALERFSERLTRILRGLRGLEVPTVLRVSHGDQIRALERTRSYTGRLRKALLARDAKAVARLLQRFRRRPAASGSRKRLARKAIAAYNRRYQRLNDRYSDVRREEARLDQAFA